MEENSMCRIPIRATYCIVSGEPVRTSTEWADIPADTIAQFFLRRLGVDAIFGEGAKD